MTNLQLLKTIKNTLDRVQEGIIAFSFHIQHMPKNLFQHYAAELAATACFLYHCFQISFQLHREAILLFILGLLDVRSRYSTHT